MGEAGLRSRSSCAPGRTTATFTGASPTPCASRTAAATLRYSITVELTVFAPITPALKLPSVPHRELLEVFSPFDVLADRVATCAVPRPTGLGCYPSDQDDRLERHLDDAHAIMTRFGERETPCPTGSALRRDRQARWCFLRNQFHAFWRGTTRCARGGTRLPHRRRGARSLPALQRRDAHRPATELRGSDGEFSHGLVVTLLERQLTESHVARQQSAWPAERSKLRPPQPRELRCLECRGAPRDSRRSLVRRS